MTVSSLINRIEHPGDDATTVFAFPFKVFNLVDLKVTLVDAAGAAALQTISTHYAVTGVNSDNGGSVTMVTPPATGDTLVIERSLAALQPTDLRNQGSYPPQNVEDAIDRSVMLVQQAQVEVFSSEPKASAGLVNRVFYVKEADPEPGYLATVVEDGSGGYTIERIIEGGF